jgi:hypothetical protein
MRINTYIVNSYSVTRSIEVRNFDVRRYYVLSYIPILYGIIAWNLPQNSQDDTIIPHICFEILYYTMMCVIRSKKLLCRKLPNVNCNQIS